MHAEIPIQAHPKPFTDSPFREGTDSEIQCYGAYLKTMNVATLITCLGINQWSSRRVLTLLKQIIKLLGISFFQNTLHVLYHTVLFI